MPGILPMKVIKIGTNSQSRIAQACDRCRSKKIRCDGVTPCCTQCKNVGFECKTSDKLSRRAFPRGYTESLEERIRSLEAEIRELKDILDEKDEKIDMLSKMQSFSTRRPSVPTPPVSEPSPYPEPREVTFKVQQLANLQKTEHKTDPYFVGASSTRFFVDSIRTKLQEKGTPVSSLDTTALVGRCDLARPAKRADLYGKVPRIASDQLVNVFFQEWTPLLPILHRPMFLAIYTNYLDDITAITDPTQIAQLNLIFGIAALANESNKELLPYFEAQWQGAIGAIINKTKLATLQCLVLAMLYCIIRGDSDKLVYFTGVACNMSRRLGLHQSQKRFSLGALTQETRKKVFWCLYTLDAFGAIALGLPRLLKNEDIETEEPADIDDENIDERGFQPTPPGEFTKLSSALALFRLARVLAKVQTELYPGMSIYELSLQKVGHLSAELDEWRNNLSPHLRLEFVKDKPSTKIISSRCPLLGLFYYYTRMLIHRPVLYSNLSSQAKSSILAVTESSKHIVQILQLLQQRNLSDTIPINKSELIISCGFGLMYHLTELPPDSKLHNDTQEYIHASVDLLERSGLPSVISFRKIAQVCAPQPGFIKSERNPSLSISPKTSQDLQKVRNTKDSSKHHLQGIAVKLSSGTRSSRSRTQSTNNEQLSLRSSLMIGHDNDFALTACTTNFSAPANKPRTSTSSEPTLKHRVSALTIDLSSLPAWNTVPNLDYLPLGTPSMKTAAANAPNNPSLDHDIADWESLITSLGTSSNTSIPCDQSYTTKTSIDSYQISPPPQIDWDLEWTTTDGWMPSDCHISSKSVLSLDNESSDEVELNSCNL